MTIRILINSVNNSAGSSHRIPIGSHTQAQFWLAVTETQYSEGNEAKTIT
jgi:hypothetical protein